MRRFYLPSNHVCSTARLALVLMSCAHAYVNQGVAISTRREQRRRASDEDDVFYLFLQKQKIGAELHIYPEEGTYHKRLFRGPNTNDIAIM